VAGIFAFAPMERASTVHGQIIEAMEEIIAIAVPEALEESPAIADLEADVADLDADVADLDADVADLDADVAGLATDMYLYLINDEIINTVDDGGSVGQWTSIAIGTDGLPVISYYEFSGGNLKVAHCNDAACTSAGITTVDGDDEVGQYTSIAIGTDGFPVISYFDDTNDDLKVAHCNDAACTSAGVTIVDDGGGVTVPGSWTSIAIGTDGFPVISYYDSHLGHLRVAHCTNVACTSAGITSVDGGNGGGNVGDHTSIAIGTDGFPVISYHDITNGDLKVAHCDDAACTSAGISTVDDGGGSNVGIWTSIAIGTDGLPVISYNDDTNNDLKVAHCNDAACTSAGVTIVDDSAIFVDEFTSIAIGINGLPVIGYHHNSFNDLRVAYCTNVPCTSFKKVIVDDSANVGDYTSIAIGTDGLPVISYYSLSNTALKVTHCNDPFCRPDL